MMPNSRLAAPNPTAMLESLRGLGYSTATALADLIDNSIAAGATHVNVNFCWQDRSSYVSILDNGRGMDGLELERAMRLGAISPREVRATTDLGRFGLGLKTASFSQCRRLTVASRKGTELASLRWDLDYLASVQDGNWYLLEGAHPGSEVMLDILSSVESGTLVLWESMDRLVPPGATEQDFLDIIDSAERHLSMVFHRYIGGPRPRMRIAINGRPIQAWDPFLTEHSATWSSPLETLHSGSGVVLVRCHVLPHRDRLQEREYASAAGPDGWTAQQGFYVYRNERLLVHGSWLSLGYGQSWTKEESHRLARIRVDISNSADEEWHIDVRKSTARPPLDIRGRLLRLAEDTRARARRIFAYRGRPPQCAADEPVIQAWRAETSASGIRYRIDREHPAIKVMLERADDLGNEIEATLRIVEETVPVQRIWLDTAEAKEVPRTGFDGESTDAVRTVLMVMYKNMIHRRHIEHAEAKRQLLRTDPFNNYPELVAALPDQSGPEEALACP